MNKENIGAGNETEYNRLKQVKLDYAWKYFEYHAKQRTAVFNFFIVFSGVFFRCTC